jgi:hypothetical protein
MGVKLEKVTITNLEKPSEQVVAKFNPTNISIDRSVKWNAVKGDKSDVPAVEYTQGDPEKLKLELLFDGYEEKQDIYDHYVQSLRAFCQVPEGATGEKKHPPRVMVSWGDKKFLNFKGVITALQMKYTMFLPDGTPTRATVTLTVQASRKAKAKVKKKKKKKTNDSSSGGTS